MLDNFPMRTEFSINNSELPLFPIKKKKQSGRRAQKVGR
jgi:hypothetical protein